MIKNNIYLVVKVILLIFFMGGYPFVLLHGQNLVIDSTTFDAGQHLYFSPGVITSPDTCAKPVQVTGDSHIEYKAVLYVHLGGGFSTSLSSGCGTFHAYTGNQPQACPVAIITGAHVFCGSSILSAATSTNDSGTITSYQWQLNGKKIQGATSVTYTASLSGDYTVLISNSYHCTVISNVFSVICYPAVVPSITGPASVCAGSTGNVYTTQADMTGYLWTVSAGGTIISGDGTNTILVTWNLTGAQTISVNYTNGMDCTAPFPTVYNVIVNPDYPVSGTLAYYKPNGSNVPMNNVELWLMDGNKHVSTAITASGTGYYSFDNVCNGNYALVVHDNGKPVGGINATDAAQVNWWGPHPYNIEQVKFMAGDVQNDYWLQATDAFMIQSYFVYGTPFTRTLETGTPWTYWKAVGNVIHNNYAPYNGPSEWPLDMTITVSDAPVSYDVYGMSIGDFNGSFIPGNTKEASATIQLVYDQTLQVEANTEFALPVRIVNSSMIGAVSLIMNFPSDLVEVKDLTMTGVSDPLQWTVKGNELRIGWNSRNPLSLDAGDELVTLHLRTAANFCQGQNIRFTLAPDPLNEFADNFCNVIPDVVLSIDVIGSSPIGITEHPATNDMKLENHPNPFNEVTVLTYTLPFDGQVTLTIHNLVGQEVKTLVNDLQAQGDHMLKFDAGTLMPGVYVATLKLKNNGDESICNIKLTKSR